MNKPIATKTRVKEILDEFGLSAKKGYGQNFIIEPKVVEKIATLSDFHDGAVLEIGPGLGALTEQLAKQYKKVIAFEIDTQLLEVLDSTLQDYDNVEIRHGDFLEADLAQVVNELHQEVDHVVVCANLPYYITTPILFKIFESKVAIDCITVMMQKEVADRFCAEVSTKDYNALSVISQYQYEVKMVMKINKSIFDPKPNVDSAVIQFRPRTERELEPSEESDFYQFVKMCFKQRRKTLSNNLKEGFTKAQIETLLEEHSATVRAEQLSLQDFIRLFRRTLCLKQEPTQK